MRFEIWYIDQELDEHREFADDFIELQSKVIRILSDDDFDNVTITKKKNFS